MTLTQKLILYVLAVSLIPVAATGFTLIHLGETALRERIEAHHRSVAGALAAKVAQSVEDVGRRLIALMQVINVDGLNPQEREGLQRLLYQQSDDISLAVLVDASGDFLAPPIFLSPSAAVPPSLEQHPRMAAVGVDAFVAHLPVGTNPTVSVVRMSAPYFPNDGGAARIAVSVPCCADAKGQARGAAAIELALRRDVLRVQGLAVGRGAEVWVVDALGQVLLHPTLPAGTPLHENGGVAAFLQRAEGTVRYQSRGETLRTTFASVSGLGWGVLVEQNESAAFAAATGMRRQTLGWVLGTTLVVIATGLLFAGALRRRLQALVWGARAFGQGRLDERVAVEGDDELGELANTMNTMAGALSNSLLELQAWSETLERRVEERTQERDDANAQLLTTSKLAAMGQLGAGVAHELNNPLTGILGYTQLLLHEHPSGDGDHEALRNIESAAKRCREITMNLLRFSEGGLHGPVATSINDVVNNVLSVAQNGFAAGKITIEVALAHNLARVVADPGQIALVLLHMLNNARTAMAQGGTIRVATQASAEEGGVQITVADTGEGIAPEAISRIFDPFFTTKREWTATGLGLSVAYRIVQDHGGRIDVTSNLGQGTTFEVFLPRVSAQKGSSAAVPRPAALST